MQFVIEYRLVGGSRGVMLFTEDNEIKAADYVSDLICRYGYAGEEEPRFATLEVIRKFALEALAESGELNGAQKAHSAYYLSLVITGLEQRDERWQRLWIERIEKELDNLRAALQYTLE